MESVTNLNLNLQYPNYTTTMHAVQNDRLSRKIAATLSDGATAWTPPSGTLGIVRFVKPDKTMGFYDTDEDGNPAVTWTGNVATIMLAEQILTVPGDVFCQINFYNASEERLSTFTFVIKVQPNVITDETIESTNYFNILTKQIADILSVISDIPIPSTSTPLMDGTASGGSEVGFARGDHRHPTDTSRASTAVATTSANGLMSSTDKAKLDGIAAGAQVNTITGVKGNAESSYRTGNVNITPDNVGAVPTTRTVNGKQLNSNATINASDIPNDSTVDGTNVDDALDNLKGEISDLSGGIDDNTKATFSGLGMFNRIGVIGDSFATGGINLGSASYVVDSSWINVIGRNLGIAATRYAKGGYNTRKFVDSTEQDYNKVGLGKMLSDISVKNTCGLYIFALGINDTTLGASYIGSVSDINISDPSQNADTFYGNAGRILSNIITNAPNSKIIMSTFTRPTSSSSEQTLFDSFNTAIIAISNKFSVPYIDIRTDEYFKSTYYANGIRNNHPTLDLYVGYANAMMRMCAKAIVDNNDYFYDYKNTQIYNDTYYHSGETMTFTSVYAQFFAIANNTTQLRIFIPLNKPVTATSFTMVGGFYARSPSEEVAINGTIVESSPTGNDAVFGNATVVDNGIAFTLTFATGTLTARQVYGVATSSVNPLTLTFS